jgi:hypothetical protein
MTARGRRSPRLATAARGLAYSPLVGREGGAGWPTTRKDGKILFCSVLFLCLTTIFSLSLLFELSQSSY